MINLAVLLRRDLNDSQVTASGFELLPLNDPVARRFGIERQVVSGQYNEARHGNLWACINNWWGRYPNEFVTGDPVVGSGAHRVPNQWTPYADSWGLEKQVRVERKVVGCRLLEASGSVDAVAADVYQNWSEDPQNYDVALAYQEAVTDQRYSSKHWSASLTNSLEVSVGGEYAGFKAEAKRSISLTIEGGGEKGRSHSEETSKGVTRTVRVKARPLSEYPVSISAGRGSLRVAIDYEYRLQGCARALYTRKALNGQLSSPDMEINELLKALNLPTVLTDQEELSVGFFTHGSSAVGHRRPLSGEAP